MNRVRCSCAPCQQHELAGWLAALQVGLSNAHQRTNSRLCCQTSQVHVSTQRSCSSAVAAVILTQTLLLRRRSCTAGGAL